MGIKAFNVLLCSPAAVLTDRIICLSTPKILFKVHTPVARAFLLYSYHSSPERRRGRHRLVWRQHVRSVHSV